MNKVVGNKVVLVTGGGSGIGLNIVDKCLKHGAKIAIIVDINEEFGTEAIGKMTEKYGQDKAVFFKCDIVSDLEDTFQIIIGKYKAIDVLVNNAGIANEKSIRNTININVIALMEWSVKFHDYMRRDRGGSGGTIINMASIFGLKITPYCPYYHTSKFAVIGFSKSLGHEYNFKKSGVRVIALCPGFTYTELTATFQPRYEYMLEDFRKETNSHEWQGVDAVGEAIIEVLEKAESGTVWVTEGFRPAIMV